MYIFILILACINFFIYKYSFLSGYLNFKDKNTNVPVLGGLFIYLNYLIFAIYYFYNPENLFFSEYFKEFFSDQKEASFREIFVFFTSNLIFFDGFLLMISLNLAQTIE